MIVESYSVFLLVISTCIVVCSTSRLVELNHESLGSSSQMWPKPEYEPVNLTPLYKGYTKDGYWFSTYKICTPENAGTHFDAPSQYAERGWTLDQIPVSRLIAPVVVIDIREKVKNDSIYQLTPDDIIEWVETYGLFPNNSVVLVQTGWSERYRNKKAYFGHDSDTTKLIFPGVSVAAAQTLIGYIEMSAIHIVGLGIDAPSIDYGPSRMFPSHQELSSANVYVLENLNNLDAVPARGAEVIVMPLKIKGASGSPCRVLARIPDDDDKCRCDGRSKVASMDVILGAILAIFISAS